MILEINLHRQDSYLPTLAQLFLQLLLGVQYTELFLDEDGLGLLVESFLEMPSLRRVTRSRL